MENKRRFHRIVFSTPVSLKIDDEVYSSELIDLSLKGALIKNINDLKNSDNLEMNGVCNLSFKLEDSEAHIEMLGTIAHIESDSIGIKLDKIDIDSVSHLKRLIALNIGEESLLHRDLENLGESSTD